MTSARFLVFAKEPREALTDGGEGNAGEGGQRDLQRHAGQVKEFLPELEGLLLLVLGQEGPLLIVAAAHGGACGFLSAPRNIQYTPPNLPVHFTPSDGAKVEIPAGASTPGRHSLSLLNAVTQTHRLMQQLAIYGRLRVKASAR